MLSEADVSRLVERVRGGEVGALAELYELQAEELYRVAFSLTASTADAQDVVQEVFVGLPAAIQTFRGEGSFDGWLRKVTIRTALLRLRTHRNRREVPLGWGVLSKDPPAVLSRIALERALITLPDRYRVPLVLSELHGYSHREIGEMLGITASTSATRVWRARALLREELLR